MKTLGLILFSFLIPQVVFAQRVGDKVMLKVDAKYVSGTKELPWSEFGATVEVTKIQDDLLMVDNVKGWIKKSDVVSLDDAPVYFTDYLKKNPNSSAAYYCRSVMWIAKGEYDSAIKDLAEAIRLDPNDAPSYYNRGVIWISKGKYDRAIKDFTEAIRLDPNDAANYANRGSVWGIKGEYDNAIKDFSEAIRLDPRLAPSYYNRGLMWLNKGEFDRAIKDFTDAVRLDPNDAASYANRGVAWANKGEYDSAIKDYTEAIRLDPKNVRAYHGLSWLYSTCPDPKCRDGLKAVSNGRKACELTNWKDEEKLGTLAVAYAESGDFDEAIKWLTKAMEMNPDWTNELLQLFKQGKPYHEKAK